MKRWSTAIRIRRFIITWARESYGVTPINPPKITEVAELLSDRRKKDDRPKHDQRPNSTS